MKNALEIIDDLILGPYQKIGRFGYFYKWNHLMDYQKGQKACSQLHGHIIEFDERNEGQKNNWREKIIAVYKTFKDQAFFVGLTDLDQENIWKWSSSGREVPSQPMGSGPWANGEPNNADSENCAHVLWSSPYDKILGSSYSLYGLNDIKCSTKLPIICEKNSAFSGYNELAQTQLP